MHLERARSGNLVYHSPAFETRNDLVSQSNRGHGWISDDSNTSVALERLVEQQVSKLQDERREMPIT